MTQATPPFTPWPDIPDHDLRVLVAHGKAKGTLTIDEVVYALRAGRSEH